MNAAALLGSGQPARVPRYLPVCLQCPQPSIRGAFSVPHVYASTSPAGQKTCPSARVCACTGAHHVPDGGRPAWGPRHSEPGWQTRAGPGVPVSRSRGFAASLHGTCGGQRRPHQPAPAWRLSEQLGGASRRGLDPGETGRGWERPAEEASSQITVEEKRRRFIYGCGENMARALGLAGKGAIRAARTQMPRARSGGAPERAGQAAGSDLQDREPGA